MSAENNEEAEYGGTVNGGGLAACELAVSWRGPWCHRLIAKERAVH